MINMEFENITNMEFEDVVQYLESKIDILKFVKSDRDSGSGREVSFLRKIGVDSYYYEVLYLQIADEIRIHLIEITYVKGESLADPTKTYVTTTGYDTKKKTKQIKKVSDDANVIKRSIDKFF